MKENYLKEYLEYSYAAFLCAGIISVAKQLAMFIGFLVLLIYLIEFDFALEQMSYQRVKFLILVYFLILFLIFMALILLRLLAIRKLKNSNPEKYNNFVNSSNIERHKILGKLI